MTVSPHFDIREFVTPEAWLSLGERSAWLIDRRIIEVAELLREMIDRPVTINNWHTGGHYKESGLRSMNTRTGAVWSQHKFGRAIDMKVQGMKPEDVRNLIRQNWEAFRFVGLTTIEKDTPTWVHCDCRYTGLRTLFEIHYK